MAKLYGRDTLTFSVCIYDVYDCIFLRVYICKQVQNIFVCVCNQSSVSGIFSHGWKLTTIWNSLLYVDWLVNELQEFPPVSSTSQAVGFGSAFCLFCFHMGAGNPTLGTSAYEANVYLLSHLFSLCI